MYVLQSRAMSNLLRGLYERKSVPLSGRLKVACYLWKDNDSLSVLGKRSFVLTWVCQELCLIYDKRTKPSSFPDTSLVYKLWKFLHTVLDAIGKEDEKDFTDLSPINVHLLQVRAQQFHENVIYESLLSMKAEIQCLVSHCCNAVEEWHRVFFLIGTKFTRTTWSGVDPLRWNRERKQSGDIRIIIITSEYSQKFL